MYMNKTDLNNMESIYSEINPYARNPLGQKTPNVLIIPRPRPLHQPISQTVQASKKEEYANTNFEQAPKSDAYFIQNRHSSLGSDQDFTAHDFAKTNQSELLNDDTENDIEFEFKPGFLNSSQSTDFEPSDEDNESDDSQMTLEEHLNDFFNITQGPDENLDPVITCNENSNLTTDQDNEIQAAKEGIIYPISEENWPNNLQPQPNLTEQQTPPQNSEKSVGESIYSQYPVDLQLQDATYKVQNNKNSNSYSDLSQLAGNHIIPGIATICNTENSKEVVEPFSNQTQKMHNEHNFTQIETPIPGSPNSKAQQPDNSVLQGQNLQPPIKTPRRRGRPPKSETTGDKPIKKPKPKQLDLQTALATLRRYGGLEEPKNQPKPGQAQRKLINVNNKSMDNPKSRYNSNQQTNSSTTTNRVSKQTANSAVPMSQPSNFNPKNFSTQHPPGIARPGCKVTRISLTKRMPEKARICNNQPNGSQFQNQPNCPSFKNQPNSSSFKKPPNGPSFQYQPNGPSFSNQPNGPLFSNQPNGSSFQNQSNGSSFQYRPNGSSFQNHPNDLSFQYQSNNPSFQNKPNGPSFQNKPNVPSFQNQPNVPSFQNQPKCSSLKNQPNNPSFQNQPNNTSFQSQPNNLSFQYQPNNPSFQCQPNNPSFQCQPNNPSFQSQPNSYYEDPRLKIPVDRPPPPLAYIPRTLPINLSFQKRPSHQLRNSNIPTGSVHHGNHVENNTSTGQTYDTPALKSPKNQFQNGGTAKSRLQNQNLNNFPMSQSPNCYSKEWLQNDCLKRINTPSYETNQEGMNKSNCQLSQVLPHEMTNLKPFISNSNITANDGAAKVQDPRTFGQPINASNDQSSMRNEVEHPNTPVENGYKMSPNISYEDYNYIFGDVCAAIENETEKLAFMNCCAEDMNEIISENDEAEFLKNLYPPGINTSTETRPGYMHMENSTNEFSNIPTTGNVLNDFENQPGSDKHLYNTETSGELWGVFK